MNAQKPYHLWHSAACTVLLSSNARLLAGPTSYRMHSIPQSEVASLRGETRCLRPVTPSRWRESCASARDDLQHPTHIVCMKQTRDSST